MLLTVLLRTVCCVVLFEMGRHCCWVGPVRDGMCRQTVFAMCKVIDWYCLYILRSQVGETACSSRMYVVALLHWTGLHSWHSPPNSVSAFPPPMATGLIFVTHYQDVMKIERGLVVHWSLPFKVVWNYAEFLMKTLLKWRLKTCRYTHSAMVIKYQTWQSWILLCFIERETVI